MRKRILFIALAGLMTLAACNKNKENQGVAQFTATIEHQGGRTSLDPNNGQINWTAGDQIVISNADNETAIFNLQSGEGTTEGGFGTSDEFNTIGPFIATYPSTAEIEADKVTFNLPATQTIGETGTFGNGANPMVAYSDDKNLQFKNLCGGLGIRLKGVGAHVTAVRITSKNTSEKLWGAYEVSDCASNEPTLTVASGNQGTNVITLNCNVTLTTAAKTFFVMLPPGTLAGGFTMEVLDGNEVLATKETTSDIALVERNTMKVFNEILIDVEFDGHVEIPTGMSNSDIIVTNFSEDAIPDENGDFAIGYSKMLVAKNADNGNIIYLSLNSIDENVRSEKSGGNDYEVNAKETAILLALRLLPFNMSHGDDEVLQRMKEIVYTLPCVQSLEDAIQNTVNNYGYLKEEGIVDAVSTVADFFYEQLSAIEPESTSREIKNPQQEQLAAPQFNPNHKHGIELRIKDSQSQYHSNPDRWTINCTGYSSLFCPVRIAAGYYDAMHGHFNESTPAHSYTMPPMSLSQYVKLAEKMSLLTMGGWAGWLELYRQMKLAMNDEEYLLQMTHVTLSNMTFELPRTTNAIGIMTPKDDEHAHVSAVLYMVLDVLTAISPVPVPVESLVNAYLLDGEFLNYCKSQPHNLEGMQNISQAMFNKLPDVSFTVGLELPLDMVNAFLKISNVCDGMDAFISLLQSRSLSTFTLSVVAEYYGISLPTVHTSVIGVTTTTATVSGSVEGGASSAIVERGFVYGDMANSESIVITVGSGTGNFETTIENLITGHQYYVMAYAKLTNGEMVYGEEKTFYLYEGDLTVYTFQPSVSPVSPNVAAFYGAITGVSINAPTIIAHGFSYGTEEDVQYTVIDLGQGEIGEFVAFVEDLVPNTEYNVIAFATIYVSGNMITLYGDVVNFNTGNGGGGGQVPAGAINGLFTINANGDQVYFSQGNLQYIGSAATPYWKFADHQWDCFGTTTGQNSSNANVDRDLFGWGTSGYNHGANCYQPWCIVENNEDYYVYGSVTYNLYDQTGQADWGYNAISNGGNQENSGWRTLTEEEWNYLINNRNTISGIRFVKANVNDINGVVLLPDNWSNTIYSLNNANNGYASCNSNSINLSSWYVLEENGAVFLPAVGYRHGSSVSSVGYAGSYSTATFNNTNNGYLYASYYVYFENGWQNFGIYSAGYRGTGSAVRLVRNAE